MIYQEDIVFLIRCDSVLISILIYYKCAAIDVIMNGIEISV